MAIDFLILALLLISFVINLLALSAFWVTPGLRTTANRFTINLLIVNLVGCLILLPTLFLRSSYGAEAGFAAASLGLSAEASDDSIEFYTKAGNHQLTIRHNGRLVEQEGVILQRNNSSGNEALQSAYSGNEQPPHTIETIYKRNATFYQELTIDEGSDGIVITEFEQENSGEAAPTSGWREEVAAPLEKESAAGAAITEVLVPADAASIRCWSIDMAAALGALAVLLVVGDTWCAVTDPLRYQSRISGLKTWLLIALIWVVGILFGALSALRELDFESETVLRRQQFSGYATTQTYLSASTANSIFGIVFACVYFVVIILLPFGFVCGMYWRIFSEARENGLRMRQNGSSPLLQSALNLTHQQHGGSSLQYTNGLSAHRHSISSASSLGGGGLQMQIDQQQRKSSPACMRRDSAAKVLLPTISDDGMSDDGNVEIELDNAGNLIVAQAHGHRYGNGSEHEHAHVHYNHNELADRNQNILLTLQTASGEIKRNYSARQLPLLGTSSQDLHEINRLQGIRQVHSSPNLQKFTLMRQSSLSDEIGSPHLLGHHELQHTQAHRYQQQSGNHISHHTAHSNTHNHTHHHHQHQHHIHQQHQQQYQQQQQQQLHALQIPAIHASPKALSYMSSLRHRLSNASSLFKYREESRAARISILVVIMFLVSYLPYGLLVLLQSRNSLSASFSAHTTTTTTTTSSSSIASDFAYSTQLSIFLVLMANLSSPFIFAYRNKRVRRGVKRLFGMEKRCRERVLQRQASSLKASGANIKRNSSKVSTYSSNSCKYLTPQSSVVSNGAVPQVHTLALRPNHSCSTLINLNLGMAGKKSASMDQDYETTAVAAANDKRTPQLSGNARPVLQRGITIVEQIPLSGKFTPNRHNLFKMFFQSSKSLSCAAAQACAQASKEPEPTEV